MKSQVRAPRAPLPTAGVSAAAPRGHAGGNAAAVDRLAAAQAAFKAAERSPLVTLSAVSELAMRFGLDGQDLKVRAGTPEVGAALDLLQADAAAVGTTLYFRAANPGREEVAHELTHVAQAGIGRAAAGTASKPGGASEAEAEAQADRVLAGEDAEVTVPAGGDMQGSFWPSPMALVEGALAVGKAVSWTAGVVASAAEKVKDVAVSTTEHLLNVEAPLQPVVAGPVAQGGGDTLSAAPSSTGSVSHWYKNGMNTPQVEQAADGSLSGAAIDSTSLSILTGVQNELQPNPTNGAVRDLAECGEGKFIGIPGEGVSEAANEYLALIASGQPVAITAHSQGAIQTSQALDLVYVQLVAEAEAQNLANPEGWAASRINQNVEVLLLGPGKDPRTFGDYLDQANITTITDEGDLVSQLATLGTPLDLAPMQVEAALGVVETAGLGIDVMQTVAGWAWEKAKDPESAPSFGEALTEEHSMQNYLQEHADEILDWHEKVEGEHGK